MGNVYGDCMNKYWASIICVAMICITVLSYFIFFNDDKYIYEHFDDRFMLRIDKDTGDTWEYRIGSKWEHKNFEIW